MKTGEGEDRMLSYAVMQCDRISEENDGVSFTFRKEFISQSFYWSTDDKKEDASHHVPDSLLI